MATYELHLAQLKSATTNLETIIDRLKAEIDKMTEIRSTLLSDNLWKGSAKTRFSKDFDNYQNALQQLYAEATDHYNKLLQIINEYAKAEN